MKSTRWHAGMLAALLAMSGLVAAIASASDPAPDTDPALRPTTAEADAATAADATSATGVALPTVHETGLSWPTLAVDGPAVVVAVLRVDAANGAVAIESMRLAEVEARIPAAPRDPSADRLELHDADGAVLYTGALPLQRYRLARACGLMALESTPEGPAGDVDTEALRVRAAEPIVFMMRLPYVAEVASMQIYAATPDGGEARMLPAIRFANATGGDE